jgi:UV DNA damage endonuclease
MSVNLGYACINTTLQKQSKVMCNRGMIKRTWLAKGMPYASELALSNVRGLQDVVRWNNANDISVYRITSCLFPWMSEYDITQLPDYQAIVSSLAATGRIARQAGQRLSFHPGQFCVLASPNESTVVKSLRELDQTAQIMDLLGMPRSPAAKINIHVGGAYGERDNALARFCSNFERLTASAQSRLTVENDDKPNLYSTKMLYDGVHKHVGIPIVFDSHHFDIGPQDLDYHDSYYLARSTWPHGIKQQCHHSNSRRDYEDPTANKVAHSTWFYTPFESYGNATDVVLECKAKELAVLKYRDDFCVRAKAA